MTAQKPTPVGQLMGWRRGDSRIITPGKRRLTADEVRAILGYEPDTGVLRWKVKRYKTRIRPGDVAGCVTKPRGEVVIGIGSPPGNQYKAHHLAWLIMTGEWPNQQIDHIDGDPSNNRWANLREATHSQNQHNRPRNRNNTSEYKGVSFHRGSGKWFSMIRYGGNQHFLGAFNTAAEAGEAYRVASLKWHGDFSKIT